MPVSLSKRVPAVVFLININTANKEALKNLLGIGPVYARRIIDYRNQHGRFRSVNDLINLNGIGPKTLEKLRECSAGIILPIKIPQKFCILGNDFKGMVLLAL